MSASRRGALDPEELLLRARRGRLSADEDAALERALEADPSLRLLLRIGSDFDAIAPARTGDGEVVSRAARAALSGRASHTSRGHRTMGLALVAALLASGAAAWGAFESAREQRGPLPPAHPIAALALYAGPNPVPVAAPQGEQPLATASGPVAVGVVPFANAARRRTVHAPMGAARGPQPTAPADETAADLFREASAARRLGDMERACSGYRELERRFPGSEEARLSEVSHGKLLLQTGNASEAERHFAGYLSAEGGALAEEALVGRAESLRRLGRGADEQRVWEELVRNYPGTLYAAHARGRIEELTGVAP